VRLRILFSSPHALNSPAAITVMIPRRHISLCSPLPISLCYAIVALALFGDASVGNVERRRLHTLR
jgi:hypothetical protein